MEKKEMNTNGADARRGWLTGRRAAIVCLGLAALGLILWLALRGAPSPQTERPDKIVLTPEGVVLPPVQVDLDIGANADMMPFFIYKGGCYVGNGWIDGDDSLAGEKLGSATGLIDEWTRKDGYVELAGSVKGDFYAVSGYDPSFMLCMKRDDGGLMLLVRNSDITLRYGRELFEDRLHLSRGWASVEYESRESWDKSLGELKAVEDASVLEAFIAALGEGEFLPLSEIPLEEGESDVYSALELYHLYFQMEDGLDVHIRLFEGGYVAYYGISGVGVKVEDEAFAAFLAALG